MPNQPLYKDIALNKQDPRLFRDLQLDLYPRPRT